MRPMNIGEAAAAAGITPKMIRHYETLGLIPEADRTDAGYRLYGEREVGMLRFIRQSRALGFSMKQIESLLALWRNEGRQSREVKQLAEQQLAQLEERQREIDQMRGTLDRLVARCAGDESSHCSILDRLADAAEGAAATPPQPIMSPLKQVRAGTRRAAKKTGSTSPAARAQAAGHTALVAAWSGGSAGPSAGA